MTHLRLLPDYRVVSLVLNRDVTTHSPLQSDALTVFLLNPRRRRDEGAEMQEEVVMQRPEAPEGHERIGEGGAAVRADK